MPAQRREIALISLLVLFFLGSLLFVFRSGIFDSSRIEILETPKPSETKQLIVEIAGEVVRPGVYKLNLDSRMEDLLIAAGGISADANREWVEKNLNRASKVSDGQKVYIPNYHSTSTSDNKTEGESVVVLGQSSSAQSLININSASLKELDKLPGVGPVYAQNIIDHRPYSSVEELLNKQVVSKSIYEKVKQLITTN